MVDKPPSPSAVAEMLAFGRLPVEQVPLWAALWLVDGHDGDDLRTLAGLSGQDAHEVRAVLPGALAECGTAVLPNANGALLAWVARKQVQLGWGEEWVLDKVFEVLVDVDDLDPVWAMPLARLYKLSFYWDQGGMSREQIRVEVRKACAEQLES